MIKPNESFTTALVEIANAIVEAVRENGSVPAGTLYALLSAQGCSLATFEQLMDLIVASGRLRKLGDLYMLSAPEPDDYAKEQREGFAAARAIATPTGRIIK